MYRFILKNKLLLSASVFVAFSQSSFAYFSAEQHFAQSEVMAKGAINQIFDKAISAKHYSLDNNQIDLDSETDFSISANTFLLDGIYLLDKGHGWIRGEEDFIQKAIGLNGTEISIETTKNISSTHSVAVSGGIGIKTSVIEAMITQSYGSAWKNSKNTSVKLLFTPPEGENIYTRVYATHQRFDTIEVRSGKVVEHRISYQPTGSVGKQAYYKKDEYFDESSMLESHGARRVTDPTLSTQAASHYLLENGEITTDVVQMTTMSNDIAYEFIQKIDRLSDDASFVNESVSPEVFASAARQRNYSQIQDGFYSINYGENWIQPDDQGVLYTMHAPENASSRYSETLTATYSQNANTTLASKVTIGVLQAALSLSYGHSWSESKSIKIEARITTPATNSTFTKIYANNERIDVVEIRNGQLYAQTATFIPKTFTAVPVHYVPSMGLDQADNYSFDSRYLLGIPKAQAAGYIPRSDNFLNFTLGSVGHYQAVATPAVTIDGREGTYDFLLTFTVPSTGVYDFGYYNVVKPVAYSNQYYGWYGNYEIWENSPNNNALGSKIFAKQITKTLMIDQDFEYLMQTQGFDFTSGYNRNFAARHLALEAGKLYTFALRSFIHNTYTQPAVKTVLTARKVQDFNDYKTVHFNSNGGSQINSIKAMDNRTLFTLSNPTKNDYIFESWYYDEALTQAFIPGISLVQSQNNIMYLHAKWVSKNAADSAPPSAALNKDVLDVIDNDQTQSSFVSLSGSWTIEKNNPLADNGTLARSNKSGDSIRFVFDGEGGQIELYGRKDVGHGSFAVYLNGRYSQTISTNGQYGASNKALLYKSVNLSPGINEIEIVLTSYTDVEIDYARIVR